MMRPVGNIPGLVPGSTNGIAAAAPVKIDAPRAVRVLV